MRTLCKKALAFCLVAALALTCFVGTFSVSAAEFGATITVAPVTVEQGTDSVPVVLAINSADAGINEALIKVSSTVGSIDAEAILVKDAAGTAYTEEELKSLHYYVDYPHESTDLGSFFLSARTIDGVLGGVDSAFIKVVFTVDADIAVADYPVKIDVSGVKAASAAEDVIKFTYEEANISVVAPHVHNVVWTSDKAGNHTSSCDAEGCKDFEAVTEACADGDDEDKLCDKCGYDLTPAVHTCEYVWTYNADNFNYDGVCSCGETTTKALEISTEKTSITFSAKTFELKDAISMYMYVPKSNLDLYDGNYVEFYQPRENKTAKQDKVNYDRIVNEGYGDECIFIYEGIAALEMNDIIYCTLYSVKDGVAYPNETFEYSIATYVKKTLPKASTPDNLKTLLVDMLNYGSASQIQFNYKTTNLVNSLLTGELEQYKAFATTTTPDVIDSRSYGENNSAQLVSYGAMSVSLESRVEIIYYLDTANYAAAGGNYEDLTLVVEAGGTTTAIPFAGTELSGYNDTERLLKFNGLNVKQMRTLCYGTVYEHYGTENQRAVSNTGTYSIETYVARTLKNNANDTDLCNVVSEMIKYGDAAVARWGN